MIIIKAAEVYSDTQGNQAKYGRILHIYDIGHGFVAF